MSGRNSKLKALRERFSLVMHGVEVRLGFLERSNTNPGLELEMLYFGNWGQYLFSLLVDRVTRSIFGTICRSGYWGPEQELLIG